VFAIGGPGLTNLITPMAQALNCSVPMLVVTAANPAGAAGLGLGLAHDLRDQSALAGGAALWSRRIEAPEALGPALDAAMAQFAAGRPGPAHIEVPTDVLAREAPAEGAPPAAPAPPEPSAAQVAEIVMRLASAKRPLLIFGGGAARAGPLARALAERLEAPTLLTSNARGLLPRGHRLLAGGWLHTDPIREALARADAVLAVGTELSETDFAVGAPAPLDALFAPGALIRVDIDPAQLERNAPPALAVAADAARTIAALLESLPQRDSAAPEFETLRGRARAAAPARLARHQPLLDAVWEHAPDAIVIGDVAEPALQGRIAAEPPAPRRWWTAASGFGALGYALPAAIGARVAEPRRPVIALLGDGGALFTAAEIAAAVEADAHVIAMVWNNTGYGETREAMRAAGIRPVAVDLSPVEFQPLARALGAAYARVHSLDYLRDALRKAIMRPGPSVLELREEFWFES
jgi:acetolactate synthase-1/2/3 large subunit